MRERITIERELEQKRGELSRGFSEFKTLGDDQKAGKAEELKKLNDAVNALQDEYVQAKSLEDMERQNQEALEGLKSNRTVDRRVAHGGGEYPAQGAAAGGAGAAKSEQEADEGGIEPPEGFKSLGQWFTRSQQYKANREDPNARYKVDIPGVTLKSAIKAVMTTAAGIVPYPAPQADVVPIARRRPVVADLIPQTETSAPSIIYLEQTTATNNAAAVTEGAAKPESALGYTRRTIPLEVIAHILPVTNQELEDIPGIRDIIDQELVAMLRLAEEGELLNGDGSSPNLTGIITRSGVQTQDKGTDDVFTAVMKAATLIRHTGFADVTAGVMNPNDWLGFVTSQDDLGRFIYGSPADEVTPRVWGIPIVVTTAMTENTAVFGDFAGYARIWRKGGIRVEVGLINDDFQRNQQSIRVEERIALQVRRPAAFCLLTGL